MAFSFGFSGDDIEEDPNDVQEHEGQQQTAAESNMPPPLPAKAHDIQEMVGIHFIVMQKPMCSISVNVKYPFTALSIPF